MSASQTKDYYKLLGIEKGAEAKAIKAAFRKLARKYHPDVNQGDKNAEESFKGINEAYNVLSDPASRKLYDRYGGEWERYKEAGFTGDEPQSSSPRPGADPFGGFTRSGGAGGTTFRFDSAGQEAAGFPDFMQSIFGENRRPGRTRASRPTRSKGEDLEVKIEVSFDEAFKGATRRLDIQVPETCTTCGGAGYVRQAPCPTCDATGTMRKTKTIEVKIPSGVATGSKVRVGGQGGLGTGGGANGDVVLNITVRSDRRFERTGDDLKTEIQVPLYTAVLGGEAVVTTPTGKVALTVPRGSQNGRSFRLRGQGMPKLKGKAGERGDLLARLSVQIPETLSEKEEALFSELQALQPD